uniref:RRM domain-containing protein n=1 Tax=Strigamia maritima TaxID=126957 RepID=T1J2T6_STRMM
MSRIIVKNLPQKVCDEDLREFFSSKGEITDVQLKFKDGVFRRFAFIGFKTETEAQNAMNYFNNTFFGSSKLKIVMCAALGDVNKPRAWRKREKEKKKEIPVEDEEFEELKKDPQFAEFLDVNTKRSAKSMCANETGNLLEANDDVNEDEDEDVSMSKAQVKEKPKKLSDFEYLQSKMVGKVKKEAVRGDDKFTIVLRNLPYNVKKNEIKHFLLPSKPFSLRVPPKIKGLAYASFKSDDEMKLALHKAKSFLHGNQIEVTIHGAREKPASFPHAKVRFANWEKSAIDLENAEAIAESGRIFIRNLSYTMTEDVLRDFFSGYGPLAEVNLPIDKFTLKNKGIGFVTFVFPEHAAKAYSELDGKILEGRIIHLLPSKVKADEVQIEDKSFKEQKNLKEKSQSGSGHNWNTLFLGTNAVANAMVEHSVAVRMALGETQLVNETRKFLEKNGVHLAAFDGKSTVERSDTTILVKNLPAGVSKTELDTLFSRHGTLKRIVQPPAGITAIVEFLAPSHARTAFKNLAYSKFHALPLYLEWAPVGTFKKEQIEMEKQKDDETEVKIDDDDESDDEPEEDTTLFVTNLNFETTDEILRRHMSKCGRVHSATISTKSNVKKSGEILSLGFGFVQYKTKKDANKALEQLQNTSLDGHTLQLKRSNKKTKSSLQTTRKKTQKTKQTSNKILVRNIPFQAHKSEVEKLFSTFGGLTNIRLPAKTFSDHHRGFGFVEFASRQDAKRAFDALSSSTHLYGRRLMLEWALNEGGPEGSAQELRRKTVHQFQPSAAKRRKMETVLDEMRMSSHEDDTFA